MVKYGKYYRSSLKDEWTLDSINYKSLKQKIKEISSQIVNLKADPAINYKAEIEKPNNNLNLYLDSSKDGRNSNVSDLPLNLLKGFINSLDTETKKSYHFFSKNERKVYILLNQNLHALVNMTKLKPKDIIRELDKLQIIADLTLDLCEFIKLNVTAIIKILKKFDKKFEYFFGKIAATYVKSRTEEKKSDLNYMLEFKLIDEASAILESISKSIEVQKDNLSKKIKDHSRKLENEDVGNSVLTKNTGKSSHINYDTATYKDIFENIKTKLDSLAKSIELIDHSNVNYRSRLKMWKVEVQNETTVVENKIMKIYKNPYSSYISNQEENDLNMILLTNTNNETDENFYDKSKSLNIFISLSHTFLYSFFYSMFIPNNHFILQEKGWDPSLSGVIIGSTNFTAFISNYIFTDLNSNSPKYYKISLVISCIFFLISNILLFLSLDGLTLSMCLIGRIILGLGNSKVVSRIYLIEYCYKYDVTKYSYYYYLSNILGLSLGFFVGSFFHLFNFRETYGTNVKITIDYLNLPSLISVGLSFIFFFIVLIFFTTPINQIQIEIDETKTLSVSSKDFAQTKRKLTKMEEQLILDMEKKLEGFNKVSNFSDTNLVAKTILKIEELQEEPLSYINKIFILLCVITLSAKILSENLFLIFPYLITQHQTGKWFASTGLYQGLVYFSMIPMNFVVNSIYLKFYQRKTIIYLVIITIAFCLLNLILTVVNINYFYLLYFLTFISNWIFESFSLRFFNKILPFKSIHKSKNKDMILNMISYFGRILGASIITICYAISWKSDYDLILSSFIICGTIYFLTFLAILTFYNELRIKAISRILRKKLIE